MENKDPNSIDYSWNSANPPALSNITTEQPESNLPEEFPKEEAVNKPNALLGIIKTILVFAVSFCFVYLFLTFPAQYARFKYFLKHLGKNNDPQIVELPKEFNSHQDLFLSTIKTALEKSPDRIKELEKKYSINISDLDENTLIIPKIEIKVPIIWNVAPDEKIMLKKLQDGVIHYNGTALPDEANGNVFIAGHSSYYWWDKGNYKTVFANLGQLAAGDEIALAYQDKVYIYRIYDKKVVKPNQVEVLQSTNQSIITLMTCVPIGTNLNRLIVIGERLDIIRQDNPQQSTSPATSTTPKPSTGVPTVEKNPLQLLPW